MRFWNRRGELVEETAPADAAATRADLDHAYDKGRRDEHADHVLTKDDVDKAYQRGRADERARHRGHPVLGLMIAVVALIGVGLVYLAWREGSFSGGGQLIDNKLAVASNDVSHTASQAVTGAGETVAGAGERVKQAGQSLDQSSQPDQSSQQR